MRLGEVGKGVGREGRGGEVGVWSQKTNENCLFSTKVEKQAACNASRGYQQLFASPESPSQAFTAATSHCHTKHTRT